MLFEISLGHLLPLGWIIAMHCFLALQTVVLKALTCPESVGVTGSYFVL